MEITVRKNDLVRELHLVQGIVEKKNSIPILSNVLAEAKGKELRISATDLDVSLRCACPAEIADEGAIPALGLSRGPREIPVRSHLTALCEHWVYGAALEAVSHRLLAASR